MNKRFTRYTEFAAMFGVDLKDYAQEEVSSGAEGNYMTFLTELRNLLQTEVVKTKKPILQLMSSFGLNTSLPGLAQVLSGLGIITKPSGGSYVFNVNRIDGRLAEFIFEYNHFKQGCLNNRLGSFSHDDIRDFVSLFGSFEEEITGVNTFQTRKRSIAINTEIAEEEAKSEPYTHKDFEQSTSCQTFGWAVDMIKKGQKVARAGWNGKGMWLKLINNFEVQEDLGEVWKESNVKKDGSPLSPWIGMKTADNKFVPWQPSQTDMLAEDWSVVIEK